MEKCLPRTALEPGILALNFSMLPTVLSSQGPNPDYKFFHMVPYYLRVNNDCVYFKIGENQE